MTASMLAMPSTFCWCLRLRFDQLPQKSLEENLPDMPPKGLERGSYPASKCVMSMLRWERIWKVSGSWYDVLRAARHILGEHIAAKYTLLLKKLNCRLSSGGEGGGPTPLTPRLCP